ncbi:MULTISPECIES: hypothetical protein [unclassified Parafrankia]|uniref:hypothetical protein n=1 Tax=Parafrankia TaxID=2994362 RepID=UPI000DA5ABA0|nr:MULTISPECIES: hypothetical protein [unclassified Parafrankia]CAI7979357.1 putative integral membrane protein [Frankia sp. Hr75.2]SQD96289.1 putative integral membrane protein [Parafrankia sp. Ea1.12]
MPPHGGRPAGAGYGLDMPHSGSFGLFLTLHVLSAVLLVGPLCVTTAAAPGLVRTGPAGLPRMRAAVRTTRYYPPATVLIVLFGLVIVRQGSFGSVRGFGDPWLAASIVLWLAAVSITMTVVARNLQKAVHEIERGGDARRQLPMITIGAAAAVTCWVVVIALMVVKPGS